MVAEVAKRLTHPGKTLRNKRQAPPAGGRFRLAGLDRERVAIEGEDVGRPFIHDGASIAARAEGAVDVDARLRLAGNDGEGVDDLVEQDGNVRLGRGHHPGSRSASASAAASRIYLEADFSALCGFQTWNSSAMPRNSA